ncbi:hypothetical protein H4S01_005621, partial [Coemansia sp. RSA 2610]
HTSLGVIWFCGGLLSTYMLRKSGPSDRSMFPAIILIFTGCAMGSHEQDTEFSTKVHFVFGLSLVLAGITRCMEIMLITTGLIKNNGQEPNPFQYIPVFFLCHSGMMFMAANRESVSAIGNMGIDIGTFSLGYLSISFLLFFYAYFLMQLYTDLGKKDNKDMALPTAADGIAYHTVSRASEAHDPVGDIPHADTHVLFDAANEDDYDVPEMAPNTFRNRNAASGNSPRSSDEIELGPMRHD